MTLLRTAPQSPLSTLAIPYTACGGQQREALIALDTAGVWFVYDLSAATRAAKVGLLVERLDGAEEELQEAVALAVEFVSDQLAYARGERVESPLGKAARERLSKIRRDGRRAAGAAASDTKTLLEPDWFQRLVSATTTAPDPTLDERAATAA